ncbi:MAG: HipA domain-containing protein [Deltaproteobacteria bacterium]|nr:HipA domain-containing protein [Deltaproteobacteria bacterium]OIP67388.1 MAG: hypothetical protein AUK30_00710 [Nitrospirae bacterium CG2_30_70_394]PIU78918.1 MAG: hypothetical protein COS73_05725 [Nitrospirae bacterium CG06_land_8_20_14_3_00_70_43]PIW82879.1 MAG: hypothetical protein COZ96_06400 [Nitrospirae bacterium CG_4_8_14_3_um_filter_70_85]PIX82866.1 MAG: hypothetical protein COZ33_08415 [Nitrospirae bacterium CG_4_10_14_3_um_filter_70_108]PJB96620.1 MAG: hypothetical protein CO080_0
MAEQDHLAVVWTRAGGTPVRMGSLYVSDTEARFQYTEPFVDAHLPGLSLLYPPRLFGLRPVVYRRAGRLHPRFQALLPPAGRHAFLRHLLLAALRARGVTPAPGFAEEWALLLLAGHGGIGHVDCFADDAAAAAWYAETRPAPLVEVGPRMGATLRDLVAWLDADAAPLLHLLGPTPTVGGAVPKLLVAIPQGGWSGEVAMPSRGAATGERIEVVLKLERTVVYPGLVELEAMALAVHRDAGFAVPRFWVAEVAGLPALAVERFDRDLAGNPIPLESWFTLLAGGARDIATPYDGSLERIGRALDTPRLTLVDDPREAKRHLFLRLVMALLTGNGDLHLDNLALLGGDRGAGGGARFSPVYDPTPMRAYSLHDLLTPLPFGDYGQQVAGQERPVGLAAAVARFAAALGIRRDEQAALLASALTATADYPERIAALTRLPEANKQRLQAIAREVRAQLAPAA